MQEPVRSKESHPHYSLFDTVFRDPARLSSCVQQLGAIPDVTKLSDFDTSVLRQTLLGFEAVPCVQTAIESVASNMKHVLRKNGDPYFVHPLQAAHILVTLLPHDVEDTTMHQMICYTLWHDGVEELYGDSRLERKREGIQLISSSCPTEFQVGRSSVILTEPELDYEILAPKISRRTMERIAFMVQVTLEDNPLFYNCLAADLCENMFPRSLTWLEVSREMSQKLNDILGHASFMAQVLKARCDDGLHQLYTTCIHQLTTHLKTLGFDIDVRAAREKEQECIRVTLERGTEIAQAIEQYHRDLGVFDERLLERQSSIGKEVVRG